MEIGSILRQTREAKGLSLQQAEEETKIRRKYLEALENEKFDVLPGPVYVKAFIKTYAKYLGLNGEELVAGLTGQAAEEIPVFIKKAENTLMDRPAFTWKPRYWRYLAAIFLVGVIALFGAAYKENNSFLTERRTGTPQQSEQTDREDVNHNNIENNNKQSADNNTTTEDEQGVNLRLNVTSERCWMLVKVDGNIAFEGTLPAGQSKDFTAQEEIWFKLGNTGAVQVVVNGENHGYLDKNATINDYTVNKSGLQQG
ncbi:helix-turn-helix domain-containing protein [Desulfolucanica intricata]|uniref:helix-turn-helix domain-containing protein n=1 Tax=Desulfolucanica intricata TaxID=1285191 RepID=UPI000836E2CA|nr:helix-turn-helix domain-containing protein [Desulfolucanica intricata]